jgi:hypothetical protein
MSIWIRVILVAAPAVGATVTVAGTLVTSPAIKIVGDEANPIVIRSERVHADVANEPQANPLAR